MLFRLFVCCVLLAPISAQSLNDYRMALPLPPGSTLVVGFLGGYERWDDPNRSVRKLMLRLRQAPGVYAESCGNHRRKTALKLIRRAVDQNQDGRIEGSEAGSVRVILVGQSWGGAAVVKAARDLSKDRVSVALTVQVDSVGRCDDKIPSNVEAAVNLYQSELFTVNGERRITPEDANRTRILANRRFHYLPFVGPAPESWMRRKFGGAHAKMEADPAVWALVEGYVLGAIHDSFPSKKDVP